MRRLPPLVALAVLGVLAAVPASGVTADDPGVPLQWGLAQIRAPAGWDVATGAGMTIAIVDSGIDLRHRDLQAKLADGVSCLGADGDPGDCEGSAQDDNGHGTHVAGIAGALTGNREGVAGVAPDAKLMPVRVLKNDCSILEPGGSCSASGTADDVAAGIMWAADHGADVINLSLGDSTQFVFGPGVVDAINYAWRKGAIPVFSTGNDFLLDPGFSDEPALVVAATNRDGGVASYSNRVGSGQWAVAAPGGEGGDSRDDCSSGGRPEGVLSTYWPDDYACLAGTSMAAPHVSGALAVLRSAGLSPRQAVDRLLATADDLGADGRDQFYGEGRINLARAVAGMKKRNAPTPTTAGPATPTTAPPGAPDATVPLAPSGTRPPAGGGTPTSSPDTSAPSDDTVVAGPEDGSVAAADLGGPGDPGAGDGSEAGGALELLAVVLALGAAGAAAWCAFRGPPGVALFR